MPTLPSEKVYYICVVPRESDPHHPRYGGNGEIGSNSGYSRQFSDSMKAYSPGKILP